MTDKKLELDEIRALAELSASVTAACACARRTYPGWDSVSSTFPDELLECLGRVSSEPDGELPVQEYHPNGTHIWSPDAPIALHYYPANRSQIWQCRSCRRAYLRYTEYGGYYLDRRIRTLQPQLITLEEPPA